MKIENNWSNYDVMLTTSLAAGTGDKFLNYFGNHYLKPYVSYSSICVASQKDGACETSDEWAINNFNTTTPPQTMLNNKSSWYRINLKSDMQIGIVRHRSDMDGQKALFFVDVNGKKKPNKVGYDVFYFSIGKSNSSCTNPMYIYCSLGDRLYAGSVANRYYEKNGTCSGDGAYCAVVIKRNGWKIPKNYPVKRF